MYLMCGTEMEVKRKHLARMDDCVCHDGRRQKNLCPEDPSSQGVT